MSMMRLQGDSEKKKGIYYQVDSSEEPIGIGGMGRVFKGVCINEKTGSSVNSDEDIERLHKEFAERGGACFLLKCKI